MQKNQNVEPDTIINQVHSLALNVQKLTTWVSSMAAVTIIFIGFVSWVFKGTMEDLTSSIRSQNEIERDVHYLSREQSIIRTRLDVLEARVFDSAPNHPNSSTNFEEK